ncbi:MAG: tripartite tricarboxylate transporter permease [Deltaproteobacteria bacterium]|nr:tripartite tricarboxylate transporter permease [Deltaproteobacteria bacterium]
MDNMIQGLTIALQAQNLFYCFIGCLAGTLVGILPGIGPIGAVALLLPVTYHLNPISGIIMMCGIAYGAMYGGSTTSILVNVPGEAASVVTCLDGHEMAKKGRGGPALGIAALGSFISGTLGVVGLMFLAPTLARAALVFDTPEYFALMMMSLVLVTYLVRGSMVKALIMVALGLVLGTVGMDALTGRERFTYGVPTLRDGIGIIPVVVGLFGVNEVIETLSTKIKMEVLDGRIKGFLPTLRDWKDSGGAIARGTFLGFFMGVLPGVSPMIPTFLTYGIEKRLSKHPEKFGTGVIEGVAGPEACNNAAAVGSFVPLLSLGIPSNAFNAVLLGALMIYGLQPGPLLITTNPDLFWGVVASMYIGNAMLVILNLPLIPLWVKVLKIPANLLSVLILLFCFLGSYSLNNNLSDVVITFAFGVLGYVLKRLRFETPPLILAFVLGPLIEMAFRQAMISFDGSLLVFVQRPICAALLLVALGILLTAVLKKRKFSSAIAGEE